MLLLPNPKTSYLYTLGSYAYGLVRNKDSFNLTVRCRNMIIHDYIIPILYNLVLHNNRIQYVYFIVNKMSMQFT